MHIVHRTTTTLIPFNLRQNTKYVWVTRKTQDDTLEIHKQQKNNIHHTFHPLCKKVQTLSNAIITFFSKY